MGPIRGGGSNTRAHYRASSVAMVSSGGGDPPRISSEVVPSCATGVRAATRFRGGLRLAAVARLGVGRSILALSFKRSIPTQDGVGRGNNMSAYGAERTWTDPLLARSGRG